MVFWVRDNKVTFKAILERLDGTTIRMFKMYTGCRDHELIYTKPTNFTKKFEKYNDKEDAYTDDETSTSDQLLEEPWKDCWVCGRRDERIQASRKVLCWENIGLWKVYDL